MQTKNVVAKAFDRIDEARLRAPPRRLHTAQNGVKLREEDAYIMTRRMHVSKTKTKRSVDTQDRTGDL